MQAVSTRTTLLMAFALIATLASAQVQTGTIAGTVRDQSGAVVPNANVTATSNATGATRSAQSASEGQYSITGLVPGVYTITIIAGNFAPYKTQTEVTVGGVSSLDATMLPGGSATTVEVVGAGGAQVNTETQELSQVVSPTQIANLPSLTRNPYDFVAISGNVSGGDRTTQGGDQNLTGRGVGYAINGQRMSGTEILLDGAENEDLFGATVGQQVPLDSVQEYRVITNNFDAQYGRASGGVVNVTTKSGTNAFHGSAWEFNRLSAYTSNTYANAAQSAPKGHYARNQFGFTVGGPVIKNKFFFFGSTEWVRVRSNAVEQAYVPTPQFLALTPPNVQSYFSSFGNTPFAFANTLIQAQVAAAAGTSPTGAFATIPAATPVLGLVNFTAPADAGGGVPQNTYRIVGRLDFNPTDKTQMFFRYGLENLDDFIGADFASPYRQYNVGDSQYNNSALFSISHIFSSTLFSNTRVSFSRLNLVQTFDPATLNVPELLITSGATVNGINVQLPGLFAQSAGLGGEPFGGPQNTLQLNHDVSWTHGAHTIRFGGAYEYEQINRAFGAFAQGIQLLGADVPSGFDNLTTGSLALFEAAVFPQGKFPCTRHFTTGALIQTPACTITLPATSPDFARSYRYHDWAAYLEDSWKIRPRLTLNFGFRYEYYGVQHNNRQNLDSNFYYGPGSEIFQRVRNGSVQIAPRSPVGSLWNPNYGTIAPRVGFAWDLFGNGNTSLRGGFGISYERNFGNVTFNVIQNPPNYATVQLTSDSGIPLAVSTSNFGPLGGANGSVPLPPSSLRHVDQNIDTAQSQFYSLSVEHQLARNTVFAIEYSGSHGIHLYDIAAFNPLGGGQAYLHDTFDPTVGNYSRPNPQFSSINTRGSHGTSRYNGLNLRFQTSNLHTTGLSLTANYTWSHSLDDLSSTFSDSNQGASGNGIGNLGYLNPTHPKLDWGSSDYDVRHRVVIAPIWETPWFKSGRGFLRQSLGGWTVVPVFVAHTGIPFSVFDTSFSLNSAAGYGIPRYVPSGPIPSYTAGSPVQAGPNLFNILTLPSALSFPFDPVLGISDFGPYPADMSRRNSFRGPGAWNFDLAVGKSFAITERVRLQFRAEGFDLFNHHNLYLNAANLNVPNFTTAAGTNGPVLVQALKGGLGNLALGGNHDERRFGQFSLNVSF